MADSKISALPASTVPLTGSEVVPLVQSGTTKKVTVDNLTAGKTVPTGAQIISANGEVSEVITNASSAVGAIYSQFTSSGGNYYFGVDSSAGGRLISGAAYGLCFLTESARSMYFGTNNTARAKIDGSTGDFTLNTGNLVISTSGKGIDFSANTHAAGMTSEVLKWYEEGTWTPNQGAGLTVVGAFSSAGRYTRVGRLVTVTGYVQGATSIAVSSGNALTTNLPFTTGFNGIGTMIANNQSVGGQIVAATTTIYTTGMTAVSAIYFTVTYSV